MKANQEMSKAAVRDELSALKQSTNVSLAAIDGRFIRIRNDYEKKLNDAKNVITEPGVLSRDESLNYCVICIDAPKTVVVFPCKHLCLCSMCASKQYVRKCPVCSVHIDSKIDIIPT